jgi:hypothetical protein
MRDLRKGQVGLELHTVCGWSSEGLGACLRVGLKGLIVLGLGLGLGLWRMNGRRGEGRET